MTRTITTIARRLPRLASAVSGVILLVHGGPAAAVGSVAQANNAFAVDLYEKFASGPGNLVFSPHSISAVFAATWLGARGSTADQLRGVMHWEGSPAQVAAEFAALDRRFADAERGDGLQLSIANGLWRQKGYSLRQEFLEQLASTLKNSLHEADFTRHAEEERRSINRWVAEQTRGHIPALFAPGSVDSQTRLVLANAIYFKGKWQSPFRAERTSPTEFHLLSGGSVTSPVMKQTDRFGYAKLGGLAVISLPYRGGALSMLVVLPDETNGLPALEKQLSSSKLEEWTAGLKDTKVHLFLPKFAINFSVVLNAALSALGMPDAFDARTADFSGITGNRDLYVSTAIHEALVDVSEEGTEAAAATGLGTIGASARPEAIPTFLADHPFLYLIRHDPTGTILFMGRLADPTAGK